MNAKTTIPKAVLRTSWRRAQQQLLKDAVPRAVAALKKESSSEGIEMLCSKVLVECFALIQSHVREEYAQKLRGAMGYQALDAILRCSTTPFYAETQLEGLHAAAMDSILGFYPSDASVRKDVSDALRTLCMCVCSVAAEGGKLSNSKRQYFFDLAKFSQHFDRIYAKHGKALGTRLVNGLSRRCMRLPKKPRGHGDSLQITLTKRDVMRLKARLVLSAAESFASTLTNLVKARVRSTLNRRVVRKLRFKVKELTSKSVRARLGLLRRNRSDLLPLPAAVAAVPSRAKQSSSSSSGTEQDRIDAAIVEEYASYVSRKFQIGSLMELRCVATLLGVRILVFKREIENISLIHEVIPDERASTKQKKGDIRLLFEAPSNEYPLGTYVPFSSQDGGKNNRLNISFSCLWSAASSAMSLEKSGIELKTDTLNEFRRRPHVWIQDAKWRLVLSNIRPYIMTTTEKCKDEELPQQSRFVNSQDPHLVGRAILRALGSRCVAMGLPTWTVAQSEQLVRLGDRWFDTGISPLKKAGSERFSSLKHWTRLTLMHSRRRLMGPRDEPLLQSLETVLSMMPSSDASRIVELYDHVVTKASEVKSMKRSNKNQYRSWGNNILRGNKLNRRRVSVMISPDKINIEANNNTDLDHANVHLELLPDHANGYEYTWTLTKRQRYRLLLTLRYANGSSYAGVALKRVRSFSDFQNLHRLLRIELCDQNDSLLPPFPSRNLDKVSGVRQAALLDYMRMLTRRGVHESTISFAMFLDKEFPDLIHNNSPEQAISSWSSRSGFQDVGFKIFVAKELLRVSMSKSLGRCIQVALTHGPEHLELIMEKDSALCDCTACLLRLIDDEKCIPLRYRTRISSDTVLDMKVSRDARCMHEIYNLSHISVQDLSSNKIPDVYKEDTLVPTVQDSPFPSLCPVLDSLGIATHSLSPQLVRKHCLTMKAYRNMSSATSSDAGSVKVKAENVSSNSVSLVVTAKFDRAQNAYNLHCELRTRRQKQQRSVSMTSSLPSSSKSVRHEKYHHLAFDIVRTIRDFEYIHWILKDGPKRDTRGEFRHVDRYLEELARSSHVDRPEVACFFEINREIFERVREAVYNVRYESKTTIRNVVIETWPKAKYFSAVKMRRRWYDVSAESSGFFWNHASSSSSSSSSSSDYFPTVNSSVSLDGSSSFSSSTTKTAATSSSAMGQLYKTIVEQGWIPFHNMICSQLKCMYMQIGLDFALELSRRSCVQGLGHVAAAKRDIERSRIEHESIARCSGRPATFSLLKNCMTRLKERDAIESKLKTSQSKLESLVKRPCFPAFEELSKTARALELEKIEINESITIMSEQLKLLLNFQNDLNKSGAWKLLEEFTPLLRVPASEDCPNPPLSLDELPVTPTLDRTTRRFLRDEIAVIQAIKKMLENERETQKTEIELFRQVEEQRETISRITRQERDVFRSKSVTKAELLRSATRRLVVIRAGLEKRKAARESRLVAQKIRGTQREERDSRLKIRSSSGTDRAPALSKRLVAANRMWKQMEKMEVQSVFEWSDQHGRHLEIHEEQYREFQSDDRAARRSSAFVMKAAAINAEDTFWIEQQRTSLITIASKCRVVITSLFENYPSSVVAPKETCSFSENKSEEKIDVTMGGRKSSFQHRQRHLTPNVLRGVHVTTTTTTTTTTEQERTNARDILQEENSIIMWLQDRWNQLKSSIQGLDKQLVRELALLDQEGRELRHKENESCTRELALLSKESSFFEAESLQLTEEGLALRQLQLRASQEIRLFGEEKSVKSRVETIEDAKEVLRLAASRIEDCAVSLKNRMMRGKKEGRHKNDA